jgi:hypothetical protein
MGRRIHAGLSALRSRRQHARSGGNPRLTKMPIFPGVSGTIWLGQKFILQVLGERE